jgi:hypothetical protein
MSVQAVNRCASGHVARGDALNSMPAVLGHKAPGPAGRRACWSDRHPGFDRPARPTGVHGPAGQHGRRRRCGVNGQAFAPANTINVGQSTGNLSVSRGQEQSHSHLLDPDPPKHGNPTHAHWKYERVRLLAGGH